jgi:hypothetical protein
MPSNMLNRTNEDFAAAALSELYPLAEQAVRVLSYLADFPESSGPVPFMKAAE